MDPLDALLNDALDRIAESTDPDALTAIRTELLGKHGKIHEILSSIGSLPREERGAVGKAANAAKVKLESALQEKEATLHAAADAALGETEWVDPTLPPPHDDRPAERIGGTLHPISQVTRDVEDIFLGMGFDLLDGPWVEDDDHNFTALNIPPDHPARDMQDTFWVGEHHVLRTHTSPVQIRAMETRKPPIRAVAIGRVFRNEELDASHENTFHQVEAFFVDRDVNVGHMIYVLRTLLSQVLGERVEVRLRPSYFPFVEPGFEMDVMFRGDWMELLGCGMVHPDVLSRGGIDPAIYSGFAFGLGIDRLVMMRYGIEDIRHFMSGDLRFLRQFSHGVQG